MSEVIARGKGFDLLQPLLAQKIIKLFETDSRWIQSFVRESHMSGPTSDSSLSVRTGALRASVLPLPVDIRGDVVQAGISIGGNVTKGTGTPAGRYARVHVGRRGVKTEIKPRTKKYLAIPLEAAMTGAGVSRGKPLSGPWGETFIAKSKKGNLLIFGKRAFSKGQRQGETFGDIVPLFLLKKSVQVETRVHPEDILQALSIKVLADFKRIGVDMPLLD